MKFALVERFKRVFVPFFVYVVCCTNVIGIELNHTAEDDTTPTLEIGANVYVERCSLCHGSHGMGEGKIPLKIPNYPDTNLVTAVKTKSRKQIYNTVVYGSMLDNINKYMPPMGNELTWTELESVSMFVEELRNDTKHALALVDKNQSTQQNQTSTLGKELFESRCVLCHGAAGLGDGRMSKIIKSPPPYNLTLSRAPKEYLRQIIEKGGEAMRRSPQMPPWGGQLNEKELDAVIEYIVSLRKY